MSWVELVNHPYIVKRPEEEDEEDKLHLSYSEAHGQYIRTDLVESVGESSILMNKNPYTYLNEKNAILLNCKDQQVFKDVYEKTVEKYFKNQVSTDHPQLKLSSD
jgi:hypothetical protein